MGTGDHNHIINTATPLDSASGIFTGSNRVDAFLDSEVGDTIQLSLSVDCDSIAHVTPYGGTLENAVGSASCGVATAWRRRRRPEGNRGERSWDHLCFAN